MIKFEVWIIDKYADRFQYELEENTTVNFMVLDFARDDRPELG